MKGNLLSLFSITILGVIWFFVPIILKTFGEYRDRKRNNFPHKGDITKIGEITVVLSIFIPVHSAALCFNLFYLLGFWSFLPVVSLLIYPFGFFLVFLQNAIPSLILSLLGERKPLIEHQL